MKYKIGDKLKVKEGCETRCFNYYDNKGGYVIIKDIINNRYCYDIYNCEDRLLTNCSVCLKDEYLEPFEERKKDILDITTYEVGDVLVDKFGKERTVLGICGKVVFILTDYVMASILPFTVEELELRDYSFKTPTPKPTEEETKAFDKISNNVDGLTEPSIWFEQSKKKIEKLSGSFAFTDNDHNVQDKINEIIDHLNNQNN